MFPLACLYCPITLSARREGPSRAEPVCFNDKRALILLTRVLRAAQRAFRERKQSQLAELQLKVQQYEQGEIERNVALQNVAKRLKEENEKLRNENSLLQEKLAAVEQELDSLREVSRKRWREEASPSSSDSLMTAPQPKRPKVSADSFDGFSRTPATPTLYASSPSSIASSPSSFEHNSFSPVPSLSPSRDVPVFGQPNTLGNIFDFISSGKTNVFESGGGLDTFNCGFCTDSTPCVCRELAMQSAAEQRYSTQPLKVEHTERRLVSLQIDLQQLATPQSQQSLPELEQTSILDNLPAYQPPVPLRRRHAAKPATNSIFPVSCPSSTVAPTCSGDPSNCPACADDDFGKAFCSAISKSVASNTPCGDCPSRPGGGGGRGSSAGSGCCGNPASCGRGRESGPSVATASNVASQLSAAPPVAANETVSCEDAWRQIKSHPNVSFADLDLLADVVARRSKCSGPRVEIFPAPGTVTPERGISPPTLPPAAAHAATTSASPTDARLPGIDRDRGRHSPSLQLVPQEVLVECGRQRVRQVNADGVRDALRLLDLKFSLS